MKHVLILSITIFGCTQCITAGEKPGAIKKARTETSPRTPAFVTWTGIFGAKPAPANQSQSPVAQSPITQTSASEDQRPAAICIPGEKSVISLPVVQATSTKYQSPVVQSPVAAKSPSPVVQSPVAAKSPSPVVQSPVAGRFSKKDRLAPIGELFKEVPVIQSSILAVVYHDVFKLGVLWMDCGQVRVHPSKALGRPFVQNIEHGKMRVLSEIRFSNGKTMEAKPGMIREDGEYFEIKFPKNAEKKVLARLPEHCEDRDIFSSK